MPPLHMDLIKQKVFESEFGGATGDVCVMKVVEMEQLWKEMVEGEAPLSDIDKYEDRHLHQLGECLCNMCVLWRCCYYVGMLLIPCREGLLGSSKSQIEAWRSIRRRRKARDQQIRSCSL